MALKLRQGQVWIQDGKFIRIVQLERLEVAYKIAPDLAGSEGTHHRTTKKEFCRLLKGCQLHDATPARKAGQADQPVASETTPPTANPSVV